MLDGGAERLEMGMSLRLGRSMLQCMRVTARISAIVLGASLLFMQAPVWSQPRPDDSGAKQDLKAAKKGTEKAARTTGKDVKKGTGKAYNATKHGTKKVFHKTKTTTEGAVNGGKEGAKQ
jgi:hypothetical protein